MNWANVIRPFFTIRSLISWSTAERNLIPHSALSKPANQPRVGGPFGHDTPSIYGIGPCHNRSRATGLTQGHLTRSQRRVIVRGVPEGRIYLETRSIWEILAEAGVDRGRTMHWPDRPGFLIGHAGGHLHLGVG